VGKGKRTKKEKVVEKKAGFVREKSADNFVKNIKAMTALGWDKSGFLEILKKAPERVVPIDKHIIFKGVKNPLVTVFVGFSTKRLVEAIRRKKKEIRHICIIEPDVAVFKHLVATEDISELLSDPTIDFVLGNSGETIIPELFKIFTKPMDAKTGISRTTLIANMEILVDPFSNAAEEHKKRALHTVELVQQTVQQIKLSMGCPDDQFRRFELMIDNKENMYNSWKIKGLYEKFKDTPAIVLGGGPSLDDFIKAYKKDKTLQNSMIIAVDAVLKKLLDNGIRPHIVTRCERKLTNIFEGVKKEDTKGIYYAAYPWTPPEFFELFEDSFYLFRQNGVCLFTKIDHGFVDGGVSSGNAALEIAIVLGCKDIVLSGIDMCKGPKGETHVGGTQVEFNTERSKAKHTEIKTNAGKKAITIPVWERCRKEYMQTIDKWNKKGKKLNVINTATNGAVIPLTTYKKWDELSGIFADNQNIPAMMKKYRAKVTAVEKKRFEEILKEAKKQIKRYLDITNIAEGLAFDAKRTAMREIEKLVMTSKANTSDAYELIMSLRTNQANLDKLWGNVSDAIDQNFKQKLYPELMFRVLIFDVLQLQLFHYENSTNALLNQTDFVDQRHFIYHNLTRQFMEQVKYYLKMFEELL